MNKLPVKTGNGRLSTNCSHDYATTVPLCFIFILQDTKNMKNRSESMFLPVPCPAVHQNEHPRFRIMHKKGEF